MKCIYAACVLHLIGVALAQYLLKTHRSLGLQWAQDCAESQLSQLHPNQPVDVEALNYAMLNESHEDLLSYAIKVMLLQHHMHSQTLLLQTCAALYPSLL